MCPSKHCMHVQCGGKKEACTESGELILSIKFKNGILPPPAWDQKCDGWGSCVNHCGHNIWTGAQYQHQAPWTKGKRPDLWQQCFRAGQWQAGSRETSPIQTTFAHLECILPKDSLETGFHQMGILLPWSCMLCYMKCLGECQAVPQACRSHTEEQSI